MKNENFTRRQRAFRRTLPIVAGVAAVTGIGINQAMATPNRSVPVKVTFGPESNNWDAAGTILKAEGHQSEDERPIVRQLEGAEAEQYPHQPQDDVFDGEVVTLDQPASVGDHSVHSKTTNVQFTPDQKKS
ncbi:MAG TPA: hypothetical protein VMR28_01255 [Candidatus Saccharimonadales bacterium]|nr:hypothetical protein [Candidatus Saccharimonadales bacterium]